MHVGFLLIAIHVMHVEADECFLLMFNVLYLQLAILIASVHVVQNVSLFLSHDYIQV